jgi:hypothetical protein
MKKNNKATKVTDLILRTAWSNQEIAEKVGCTASYVWTVRKKMEDAAPPEEPVLELTEVAETSDVDAILDERGSRYGSFMGHAHITIALKQILHNKIASRDLHLFPDQLEALDMICHKLGRIANGDPNYVDSWIDIAGYATLVADRLEGKVR